MGIGARALKQVRCIVMIALKMPFMSSTLVRRHWWFDWYRLKKRNELQLKVPLDRQ